MNTDPKVDDYLDQFDGELRTRLDRLRALIRESAPDAVEGYNYGLAGYKRNGKPLVYFGGFAHHVGFYATPNGHAAFAEEFSKYKQGKGSVQFPLIEPLPEELIKKVIAYRVTQTEK